MRMTQPNLPRPYRAWGYPITPLIFLAMTLFVMYYLAVSRPLEALAGVGIMLAGLLLYYGSQLLSNVRPGDVSQTVRIKVDGLDRA
jgi:APA family basic amino acid/polyamine antiporter